MSSTSEIGHEKNVANFEDLISRCVGFGTAYNPSLTAIKIANMNTLKTNATTAVVATASAYNLLKNASNNCEIVFKPLKKLATRIMAALKSCGVSELAIADAMTYNRKIQGSRAKPVKKVSSASENRTAETPIDPNLVVHISSSQQGYDSKIEFFSKLIDLLGTITSYTPNEADLKLTALNTLLATMKTSNTAVITATTNFKNAMINRNNILYKSASGLVDIAQECKSYVKSVFGASSGNYKLVSAIKFTKRKGL